MGAADRPVHQVTYVAAEDLSAKQYYYVRSNGNDSEVVACDATTDKPIGVLQNKPKLGEGATVMLSGTTFIRLGGNVNAGDKLGPDAAGKAVAKTTAGHYWNAEAREDYTLAATPTGNELVSAELAGARQIVS